MRFRKYLRKYTRALARRIRERWFRNDYAEWRDNQLLAPPLPVDLRVGSGRNLILGVGMGYDLATLLPFIRSLRRFSDCRAALIISDNSLVEPLESEGIDCVVANTESEYKPKMNFGRTALLYRALLSLVGQIDWVFLLDTRDIVFQADPFARTPAADIAFFAETEGYTFRTSEKNRNWLLGTFGHKFLPALEDAEVLCSGTVLAQYDAAVAYCKLKLVVGSMVPQARHAASGVDQITTNVIVRLGLLPNLMIIPHDQQVATLSSANRDFLIPAAEDLFVNRAGTLPAIIHQYDRVPLIHSTISRRYA